MYVFGGKSDKSVKLNDLWQFNLQTHTWKRASVVDDVKPEVRSGHSSCVYDNMIIVFGGIYEVTKELNDCYGYSLTEKRWIALCQNQDSSLKSKKLPNSGVKEAHTPTTITPFKDLQTTQDVIQSTKQRPKSSIARVKKSLTVRQRLRSAKEKTTRAMPTTGLKVPVYDGVITLSDPTSVLMQSSVLIKNQYQSHFDNYLHQMRKRKAALIPVTTPEV